MIITAFGRAGEMLRVAADEKTWRKATSVISRNKEQEYRYSFGRQAAKMVVGMIKYSEELEREKSYRLNSEIETCKLPGKSG